MNIFTRERFIIFLLLFVSLAAAVDIYTDFQDGESYHHILKEATVILFGILGMFWIWRGLREQAWEIQQLKIALDGQANKSLDKQPQEYIVNAGRQLRDVVDKQFDEWSLTNSEREVGWLLLKGLSLKEIAMVRNTLEKTVRQQASSIYKKADLPGRHAFSAWFMEDYF